MFDLLKFYVVASRGFSARLRLNNMITNDQLSAEHEREMIKRDMKDFCKGQGHPAPIPTSLFYSLTELCRRIDEDEIIVSSVGNAPPNEETNDEAKWTKIKERLGNLGIQGEQAVDFETYRETICRFIWCHLQRELVVPNLSPPAPPAPAPTPEPSHAEFSAAPKPRRNMSPRALIERHEFLPSGDAKL